MISVLGDELQPVTIETENSEDLPPKIYKQIVD